MHSPATPPLQVARPYSWPGALPMPAKKQRLPLEGLRSPFSKRDFASLTRGYVPERLEDRWFVYLWADVLHVHRTGTGTCVYQVSFARTDEGHVVSEAWVNRDSRQYPANNDAYDAKQLAALLQRLALGLGFSALKSIKPLSEFRHVSGL